MCLSSSSLSVLVQKERIIPPVEIWRSHFGWKKVKWPESVRTQQMAELPASSSADIFVIWKWSEELWESCRKYDAVIPEKTKKITGRNEMEWLTKRWNVDNEGDLVSCATSRYAWGINQYLWHIKEQFSHHEWLNFLKMVAVGPYYHVLIQTDKWGFTQAAV